MRRVEKLNFAAKTTPKMLTQSEILKKSSRMSVIQFVFFTLKRLCSKTRGRNEQIKNLDLSTKLTKKVFNELTLYKMYFDLEKIKRLLLNDEEILAFSNTKLEFTSLFQRTKVKESKLKEILKSFENSEETTKKHLAKMLHESFINQ